MKMQKNNIVNAWTDSNVSSCILSFEIIIAHSWKIELFGFANAMCNVVDQT